MYGVQQYTNDHDTYVLMYRFLLKNVPKVATPLATVAATRRRRCSLFTSASFKTVWTPASDQWKWTSVCMKRLFIMVMSPRQTNCAFEHPRKTTIPSAIEATVTDDIGLYSDQPCFAMVPCFFTTSPVASTTDGLGMIEPLHKGVLSPLVI